MPYPPPLIPSAIMTAPLPPMLDPEDPENDPYYDFDDPNYPADSSFCKECARKGRLKPYMYIDPQSS